MNDVDINVKENIRRLMSLAYSVALKSPDPSSQNGALLYHKNDNIVVATAYNDFPNGIIHSEERWNNRDLKYPRVEHAESGVLYTAFRNGVFFRCRISDLVMVCPWAACTGCVKSIIGFGLKHIIVHGPAMALNHGKWIADNEISQSMIKENGIKFETYYGDVDDIIIRRDSKSFNPNEPQKI